MPRTPTNYSNTLIYKIVCKDLSIDYIYVGHTTSFKDRKREHKSRATKLCSFPLYQKINENGGWNNWDMIEIEKFPCNDANEARARERYWFEELKATLNARSPTLNIEKDKARAKKYLAEYNRNLSQEQRQKKTEYNNEWKKQLYTCECGTIVKNGCKYKHLKTDKHIKKIEIKINLPINYTKDV
jgi:hypothetical protein